MLAEIVVAILLFGSIVIGVIAFRKITVDKAKAQELEIESCKFRKLQSLLELGSYAFAAQVVRAIFPDRDIVYVDETHLRIGRLDLELTSSGIWLSVPGEGYRRKVFILDELPKVVNAYPESYER